MSADWLTLTVAFHDEEAARAVWNAFSPLEHGDYETVSKRLKGLGMSAKFLQDESAWESGELFGTMLVVQLQTGSGRPISTKMLEAIPSASLAYMESFDDSDGSSRTAVVLEGERASKKALVSFLDSLSPELALFLSIRIDYKSINRHYERIGDPNASVLGVPLFWHLVPFASRIEAIKKIVAQGDPTWINGRGENLLHHVVRKMSVSDPVGSTEPVLLAIELGCDVDATDRSGQTPLTIACQKDWRNAGSIKYLVNEGKANVELADRQGLKPIHHACMNYQFDWAVRYLMEAGADLNAESPLGTPLWLANRGNRQTARKLLWGRDLLLAPGRDSYTGEPMHDLFVAIHHHDMAMFDQALVAVTVDEELAITLYGLACYYQTVHVLAQVEKRASIPPCATMPTEDSHHPFILTYLTPHSADPVWGDSAEMLSLLLDNTPVDELNRAVGLPQFAGMLTTYLCGFFDEGLGVLGRLSDRGVDLSGIEMKWALWAMAREEQPPKNVTEGLIKLRSLGLSFAHCEHSLIKLGLASEVIDSLQR